MALTDNIIAYWSFDESSGNAYSRYDGNTLTNVNSTSFAAGKKNNAASLAKASSNYFKILIANQTGLSFTGDCSFSFWVQLASQPTGAYPYYHFINKWEETNGERSFSMTYYDYGTGTYRLQFAIANDKAGTGVTDLYRHNAELTNNTWYHIVLTWDASEHTMKFYYNNSLVETSTGVQHYTAIPASNSAFKIGCFADPGTPDGIGFVDGLFDEMGVWNRILTADEVTELYNNGNPPYIFSNLVGVSQMSGISTITI